jgi:DoxX-like protein
MSTPISNGRLWTARALSALTMLFMIFDGVIHLMKPVPVVEAFNKLGFPLSTSTGIGITELVCTVLYMLPRTAVIGAVLLTGVYGGAIAAHFRIADPFFDTYIFPTLLGALTWGGLLLRDPTLRAALLHRT